MSNKSCMVFFKTGNAIIFLGHYTKSYFALSASDGRLVSQFKSVPTVYTSSPV